jgi:hypothetical protein
MISILLVVAGAAILFGVDSAKVTKFLSWLKENIDPKTLAACTLFALALLLILPGGSRDDTPTPEPDAGPIVLSGVFVGPSASEDAALVGALCSELADEIEYDASLKEPNFKTGASVDELRKLSRILRCRGISIGDRQPAARDTIAAYLEKHVGSDGGPLSAESRSAWVAAFRDIGRAATDASK